MNKRNDSEIIEYICAKHQITQAKLAEQTNTTRQHISNIINNRTSMSKEFYSKLVKLYPDDVPSEKFILPDVITEETIINLRKFYRLSKAEFARQIGVNPTLIHFIEKGERSVSKALKNRIMMLYSPKEFNKPKNVCVAMQDELPEELINRADTKVITIDKSVRYLVIKIDNVK